MGQPLRILIPKDLHQEVEERLKGCLNDQLVRNARCVRVTKDGKHLKGIATFSLLTDEVGIPEAIAMITRHGRPEPLS